MKNHVSTWRTSRRISQRSDPSTTGFLDAVGLTSKPNQLSHWWVDISHWFPINSFPLEEISNLCQPKKPNTSAPHDGGCDGLNLCTQNQIWHSPAENVNCFQSWSENPSYLCEIIHLNEFYLQTHQQHQHCSRACRFGYPAGALILPHTAIYIWNPNDPGFDWTKPFISRGSTCQNPKNKMGSGLILGSKRASCTCPLPFPNPCCQWCLSTRSPAELETLQPPQQQQQQRNQIKTQGHKVHLDNIRWLSGFKIRYQKWQITNFKIQDSDCSSLDSVHVGLIFFRLSHRHVANGPVVEIGILATWKRVTGVIDSIEMMQEHIIKIHKEHWHHFAESQGIRRFWVHFTGLSVWKIISTSLNRNGEAGYSKFWHDGIVNSCERESTSIEHRTIQTFKSKHPILFSYAFTVIYPQSKQTDQNHRPGHGLNSSLPLATSPFVVCLVPPISSQFAPLTHHLLDLHPMICHPGFGAPGGSWMGSTEYLG